jgi:hypothetical protein
MKARFTEQQQAVNWQPLGDGLVDVMICLNGAEVTEEIEIDGKTVTETYWEYDFNQFREKDTSLNKDAVEAHPEKYLTYEPKKEQTLEEQVRSQEETIKMLTECLLEMSEAVYA